MNTESEKLEGLMRRAGLKPKEVLVMNKRSVIVTLYSENMAQKTADFLKAGSLKVRGVGKAQDYAKENKNTCLLPDMVTVWRVWARFQ